jgi:hypothetical protein
MMNVPLGLQNLIETGEATAGPSRHNKAEFVSKLFSPARFASLTETQ